MILSIILYSVCFRFFFNHFLILNIFYILFQESLDPHYILFFVSEVLCYSWYILYKVSRLVVVAWVVVIVVVVEVVVVV